MDRQYQDRRSHLFTVRVWREELGGGQSEWRGKVQHVYSGEARYFREWSALVAIILKMLPKGGPHLARDESLQDGDKGNKTGKDDLV